MQIHDLIPKETNIIVMTVIHLACKIDISFQRKKTKSYMQKHISFSKRPGAKKSLFHACKHTFILSKRWQINTYCSKRNQHDGYCFMHLTHILFQELSNIIVTYVHISTCSSFQETNKGNHIYCLKEMQLNSSSIHAKDTSIT